MDFVGQNVDVEEGDFSAMFSAKNLAGMTQFFLAYLMTYYMIFVIVMQMGSSSKEMKKRMWLLPMTSGVRRSNIVLAKVIVLCLAALLPAVAAFLVNTLVGGLAFGNSGAAAVSAGDLFQLGLCAAVTIFLRAHHCALRNHRTYRRDCRDFGGGVSLRRTRPWAV